MFSKGITRDFLRKHVKSSGCRNSIAQPTLAPGGKMRPWIKGKLTMPLAFAAGAIFVSAAWSQENNAQAIHEHIRPLKRLIGDWRVLATFHDRQGGLSYDEGTYHIQSVLDGTYIEMHATLWSKGHPETQHSFLEFITFDPRKGKFVGTYFYSRSSLQVTEEGEYDGAKREFRTLTFIPKENGVRDENVHTVMGLADPHKIEYLHFSRYSDESADRMDVSFTLTPK
jgi:hypothetical protein